MNVTALDETLIDQLEKLQEYEREAFGHPLFAPHAGNVTALCLVADEHFAQRHLDILEGGYLSASDTKRRELGAQEAWYLIIARHERFTDTPFVYYQTDDGTRGFGLICDVFFGSFRQGEELCVIQTPPDLNRIIEILPERSKRLLTINLDDILDLL